MKFKGFLTGFIGVVAIAGMAWGDGGKEWKVPTSMAFRLSQLMDGAVLKNDTCYDVTITGISDKRMERVQTVFCLPVNNDIFLSNFGGYTKIPAGNFTYTVKLKTGSDIATTLETYPSSQPVLVIQNEEPVPEGITPWSVMAVLSNLSISITESAD